MTNTLFLTKLQQAAMVAVMGDFEKAKQRAAEAHQTVEDVIGEVVVAHKAPPLAPSTVVQMTMVDGRPALVYEAADAPAITEPTPVEGVPVNRVVEALAAAAAPGNGSKE